MREAEKKRLVRLIEEAHKIYPKAYKNTWKSGKSF